MNTNLNSCIFWKNVLISIPIQQQCSVGKGVPAICDCLLENLWAPLPVGSVCYNYSYNYISSPSVGFSRKVHYYLLFYLTKQQKSERRMRLFITDRLTVYFMIYLIYINGTMLSNCNYNNIHLTVLSRLVTITSFFESCIFTNESIFSLSLGEFSAISGFFVL